VAARENYRLSQTVIDADRLTVKALQDLADYTAINMQHSAAALLALDEALTAAEQSERRAKMAYEQARDEVADSAWALHRAVLGAKAQVLAQYGHDSPAVQAIGLKRRSERKRPVRRPWPAE